MLHAALNMFDSSHNDYLTIVAEDGSVGDSKLGLYILSKGSGAPVFNPFLLYHDDTDFVIRGIHTTVAEFISETDLIVMSTYSD